MYPTSCPLTKEPREETNPFDSIAAAVLIVFPFQNSGHDTQQWSRAIFLAPLLLGIFCLIALVAWQYYIDRRWGDGMAAAVPLVLLRNHVYAAGIMNTICIGFPYLLCIYVFPIRFQIVHGKSPLHAGLMLLPMLGAAAVGSTVSGALNSKHNRFFETLLLSCILMMIGCAAETTVSSGADYEPKVLGFLVFIGLGFGMSASAQTILGNIESPIREHGTLLLNSFAVVESLV